MEHAVLQNPLQVGISLTRDELVIFAALQEDAGNFHNAVQQNGQDEAPRLAVVDLGGEAAANEQLQRMEQEDLQAVCIVLNYRFIPNNIITGSHCWRVLNELRGKLPEDGSLKLRHAREYARILERLARVMTIPSKQDYERAHPAHRDFPLKYEDLVKLINEMTPDFSWPLPYGEFLDRLLENMTATATLMRCGDGVFISKDREQYARRLRALATYVLRYV